MGVNAIKQLFRCFLLNNKKFPQIIPFLCSVFGKPATNLHELFYITYLFLIVMVSFPKYKVRLGHKQPDDQ